MRDTRAFLVRNFVRLGGEVRDCPIEPSRELKDLPVSRMGFIDLQCPHHGAVNATRMSFEGYYQEV